ncbi:hypothetical protein KIPB_016188, partial [Kipferlia bialata]
MEPLDAYEPWVQSFAVFNSAVGG